MVMKRAEQMQQIVSKEFFGVSTLGDMDKWVNERLQKEWTIYTIRHVGPNHSIVTMVRNKPKQMYAKGAINE